MDATRNFVETKLISMERLVELLNTELWCAVACHELDFKSLNSNHPVLKVDVSGCLRVSIALRDGIARTLKLYPTEIRYIGRSDSGVYSTSEDKLEIYQNVLLREQKSKEEGGRLAGEDAERESAGLDA